MVSQIYYKFLVNGDQYTLIGITGGDLVAPEQFGVEPTELHSDSRRGYVALYELTPEALYLRGLTLNGENGHYREAGSSISGRDFYQTAYHGPSVVIPFTGKIRIAKGYINEPYVNMGYQKAIAFKTVFDITLRNGLLVEIKDRSSEMEQKRGAFKEYYNSLSRLEQTLYAFNLDVELEQG